MGNQVLGSRLITSAHIAMIRCTLWSNIRAWFSS